MSKPSPEKDIEFHPDAWARFERAAGVVAKSPPQHRIKPRAKVTRKATKTQPKKRGKKK
jgi:hypothetical protein